MNMKQHFTLSALLSSLVAASVFALALPANAQMGSGMMDAKKGGPGSGTQQMSTMTNDMADQVMGMSGEMSKGNLSAAQQKQMGERMRMMATMMDDMSGMMGKGMMMDADTQKRMDQMRKQMDEMSPNTTPKKK
ncbi:hypothetical protein [Thiobacillus denitrificans]|uniref:Uncharacterized protein n=1 Tax=Thiobacillus denitrificans TaxID=36861 RepID=A0A106BL78_THIDE|nr:hypothetical protein [Thiobacillus denitrificans]KVW94213.1 hypothetical protein ABW22_12480 [Thiobacillus denitrificans]